MQKEIKEKLNALNSPTASIASTNSNKPFKVFKIYIYLKKTKGPKKQFFLVSDAFKVLEEP